MKSLTNKERETAIKYKKTAPKQFGDLHERMQHVMVCLQTFRNDQDDHSFDTLWHAVYDLQTEVSHYQPVRPPYGRRGVKVGSGSRKP